VFVLAPPTTAPPAGFNVPVDTWFTSSAFAAGLVCSFVVLIAVVLSASRGGES